MTAAQPTLGSISHGTMRLADLIPAFAYELRRLDPSNPVLADVDSLTADELENETGDGDVVLENLWCELESWAPEGFYFGSHAGDGADFGFWSLDGR